jgi:hypothetical protein
MISPHNRIDFFWCCRFAGSSHFRHQSLQRWHEQQWWLTGLEIAGRVVSSAAFLIALLAVGLMALSTL